MTPLVDALRAREVPVGPAHCRSLAMTAPANAAAPMDVQPGLASNGSTRGSTSWSIPQAPIEVLGEGYLWSEGPVWVARGRLPAVLRHPQQRRHEVQGRRRGDAVPQAVRLHRRQRARAARAPTGSTSSAPTASRSTTRAGSSSASTATARVARLDAPLVGAASRRRSSPCWPIAGRASGSTAPTTWSVHSSGALYFTDPPYGLEKGGDATTREIDFSGVYRVAPDGTVTLVTTRDDQAQRPGVLAG